MKVIQHPTTSGFDIVLCFVSFILVLLAPSTYSYEYCLLIHNLFLLTFAYNIYKNWKEGLLTFNLLFSVSLYCTSFIYPVFIYNTPDRYFSMFKFEFDESIISYSTGLAYLAYCFLQLGLNNKGNNYGLKRKSMSKNWIVSQKGLNCLSTFFLIMLVLFITNDGLGYFADQFIAALSENDLFMGYIVQFITPLAYSMLFLAFMLPNRRCFAFYYAVALVFIYTLAILSTGSRTIPLAMIIMTLFLYNDEVKKLSIPKLAVLGVFFVVAMALAGALRGGGELISSESVSANASEVLSEKQENYFLFANELIMCNRNLYYLVGTTETVGYTYGVTIAGSFLGMIPFLRSIIISITGIPQYVLNSAEYNTVLTSGIYHTKGLGTHVVADIYICWGIIGVILIFYLYGYIISQLKRDPNRILYMVAYYVILSNAIYACRATIFNLNQILWTVFVVYFVLIVSGKRVLLKKQCIK